MIFWGPPGVGKTSLARLLGKQFNRKFFTLSAISAGVKDLRELINEAKSQKFFNSPSPILFIDEIHRFNKLQQDALLPQVENGTLILIGATTENPFFEVNKALISRSTVFQLKPLTEDEIKKHLETFIGDLEQYPPAFSAIKKDGVPLYEMARAGKEVTVVLELMARFDEETNINWAAKLEEVGAHVVYGVVGHKTHAKLALVIRREAGGLRRYAHLGTGNYHPRTARLYEDFGLFTADEDLCTDVQEVFRRLTGLGTAGKLKALLQAPFTLHATMMEAIRRETEAARAGRKGHVIAKLNALLEEQIIDALYEASQAGVRVDLIVRGVCALRPGVPGLSENIRVRSIVGRFLEHHRVFYFYAGGEEKVYLSSADWMERNFFRRVEIAFPVRRPDLRARMGAAGRERAVREFSYDVLAHRLGQSLGALAD